VVVRRPHALINVPVAYPVYWVVLVILLVMTSQREYEKRGIAAAELSSKLSEARLAALKAQLDPHFLFNTLHSLSGVMRRSPGVAARALRELGDLVVVTSESTGKSEVRLSEELALLERYLFIERLRFGDRLRFQLDVAPDTLDVAVPPFILQPLVENAVTHGVGARVGGGTVVGPGSAARQKLQLEVKDDGVGIAQGELVEGSGCGTPGTDPPALRCGRAIRGWMPHPASSGEHRDPTFRSWRPSGFAR
jgi:sensor histidine kinase YesM